MEYRRGKPSPDCDPCGFSATPSAPRTQATPAFQNLFPKIWCGQWISRASQTQPRKLATSLASLIMELENACASKLWEIRRLLPCLKSLFRQSMLMENPKRSEQIMKRFSHLVFSTSAFGYWVFAINAQSCIVPGRMEGLKGFSEPSSLLPTGFCLKRKTSSFP